MDLSTALGMTESGPVRRKALIIPLRVDVPQDRWPVVNWLIIVGAIAVFTFQFGYAAYYFVGPVPTDSLATKIYDFSWTFVLDGFSLKGLLGHMWLHGGIIHILGNMLFLWIFGNAVCAKVGNVLYAGIYLLLGIIAGASHLVFQGGPAIGASGAINGIVGMYLVFFAQNEITCLFVFFLPLLLRPYAKTFSISSYWMILFWLVFDIWGVTKGGGRVAYFAHLGGFTGGFLLALLLLKTKMIQMEQRYEKSLLQIWADWRNPPEEDEFVSPNQRYLNMYMREEATSTEKLPEAIKSDPEPPPSEPQFIRLTCICGKRFKVPPYLGGRMGKCPNCKKRIRIPQKPQQGSDGVEL